MEPGNEAKDHHTHGCVIPGGGSRHHGAKPPDLPPHGGHGHSRLLERLLLRQLLLVHGVAPLHRHAGRVIGRLGVEGGERSVVNLIHRFGF